MTSLENAIKDALSAQEPYEALLRFMHDRHSNDGYASWSDDDLKDAIREMHPDMAEDDVVFMAHEATEAWTG